ncbi:MAG: Tfp pilus assembly protein FimT/FimU [Phycisphaerales bacterium]
MLGPARRVASFRGYTLLEILIVVVLLGIASAVVIPQVGSTSVLRVQAAVRTLVADMTFAQSDALARQQTRAIVFDVAGNTYAIVEVPGNTVEPTNNTMYTVNFNNSMKFHDARIAAAAFAAQPTLLFDELGGPIDSPGSTTPGAGGVVTITGSGSVFDVTVEAYTGRVTVVRVSGP